MLPPAPSGAAIAPKAGAPPPKKTKKKTRPAPAVARVASVSAVFISSASTPAAPGSASAAAVRTRATARTASPETILLTSPPGGAAPLDGDAFLSDAPSPAASACSMVACDPCGPSAGVKRSPSCASECSDGSSKRLRRAAAADTDDEREVIDITDAVDPDEDDAASAAGAPGFVEDAESLSDEELRRPPLRPVVAVSVSSAQPAAVPVLVVAPAPAERRQQTPTPAAPGRPFDEATPQQTPQRPAPPSAAPTTPRPVPSPSLARCLLPLGGSLLSSIVSPLRSILGSDRPYHALMGGVHDEASIAYNIDPSTAFSWPSP
eukprot:tig00021579_g22439.t1